MKSNGAAPKILLSGARSRLGTRVLEAAESSGFVCCGIGRNASSAPRVIRADITDRRALLAAFEECRPQFAIHAAAITDVDGCETNRELARSVNVDGSRNMAEACAKHGIKLIYVSTDYVFDGAAGPYGEEDKPNPLNYYSQTKLDAEKAVSEICRDAIIVRTCVPYDWNTAASPNFLMWLVAQLKAGRKISIVNDQWNSPTFMPQLAETLVALCSKWQPGIFNIAGGEVANRYDFSVAAAKAFGLDEDLIRSCSSSEFRQVAKRPLRAGLKVDKIERHLGVKMLKLSEGLKLAHRLYRGALQKSAI